MRHSRHASRTLCGRALLAAFAGDVRSAPAAHTQMLAALDFALGPSFELVLVGPTGQLHPGMTASVRLDLQ